MLEMQTLTEHLQYSADDLEALHCGFRSSVQQQQQQDRVAVKLAERSFAIDPFQPAWR